MTGAFHDDLRDAWEAAHSAADEELAHVLYTRWFTQWTPSLEHSPAYPSIVARVRASHAASVMFEDGWRAVGDTVQGTVAAAREHSVLLLGPGDFVNVTHPAAPVHVGDAVAVTRRRDRADPLEGWWYTWSANAGEPDPTDLARVYWHCPASAIETLVEAVTDALEASDLAYLLKCPVYPTLFGRCDAVVVYVARAHWSAVVPRLRGAYERCGSCLQPRVPPLTRQLAPGVAAAEDPSDGMSFGQSRATAVAHGIIAARARGIRVAHDAVVHIERALEAAGIDPERPFLRDASAVDWVTGW